MRAFLSVPDPRNVIPDRHDMPAERLAISGAMAMDEAKRIVAETAPGGNGFSGWWYEVPLGALGHIADDRLNESGLVLREAIEGLVAEGVCGRCGGLGAAGAAGLCAACDALEDEPTCAACGRGPSDGVAVKRGLLAGDDVDLCVECDEDMDEAQA